MAKIKTTVLDPGKPIGSDGRAECASPVGYSAFVPSPHTWTIVSVDETGSVWMCPQCRRIEKRELVDG